MCHNNNSYTFPYSTRNPTQVTNHVSFAAFLPSHTRRSNWSSITLRNSTTLPQQYILSVKTWTKGKFNELDKFCQTKLSNVKKQVPVTIYI